MNAQDLIYCPLDLPEPPDVSTDSFIAWMQSRAEVSDRSVVFQKLYGKPDPWLRTIIRQGDSSFPVEQPEIAEYLKQFPVTQLEGVIFLAQLGEQPVYTHVDADGFIGLRFYLKNKHKDGLHFFKARERWDAIEHFPKDSKGNLVRRDWNAMFHMDQKIYAHMPAGKSVFLLNNVRACHGVDSNTCSLGDRIAVLVMGHIDYAKYHALVARSLNKYSKYAIWY